MEWQLLIFLIILNIISSNICEAYYKKEIRWCEKLGVKTNRAIILLGILSILFLINSVAVGIFYSWRYIASGF